MTWQLGTTRIFVQKLSGGTKNVIAKLQPIQGGTVFQFFGYETNQIKINAIVVGEEDFTHLKSLTTSGNVSFELMSPEGDLGDFFVSSITGDREKVISQTIRPDLDCESPVYAVDIELYEDV